MRCLPPILATALLLASVACTAAAVVPPDWARTAAEQSGGDIAGVDAVVLSQATDIAVGDDGTIRERCRRVVQFLGDAGRRHATLGAAYVVGQGSIRSLQGWVRDGQGDWHGIPASWIVDRDLDAASVASESRWREIGVLEPMPPGSIFAAEYVLESRAFILEARVFGGGRVPTRRASVSLALPAGWAVDARDFVRPPDSSARATGSHHWEWRDLPAIPEEAYQPAFTRLSPWLALTFHPPRETSARHFSDWGEVSRYLDGFAPSDGRPDVQGPVADEARRLAGQTRDEWGRIQAVIERVRGLRYVSLQLRLRSGGGYRPRPPAEVLEAGYGDCKDKANLLRSMATAAGLRAWNVAVYSSDPGWVWQEWPSPTQFDHMISAIAVSETLNAPAVLRHATLGPLLFVDPTSTSVPLGELPLGEQGAPAALIDASAGGLLRLPDPENRSSSDVEWAGALDQTGTLRGRASVELAGSASWPFRRSDGALGDGGTTGPPPGGEDAVFPGVELGGAGVRWEMRRTGVRADAEATARGWAAPASEREMLVPCLPPVGVSVALPVEPRRATPYVLEHQEQRTRLRARMPDGWRPAEVPPPARVAGEWGEYELRVSVVADTLCADREFVTRRGTYAADQVRGWRSAALAIRRAERQLLILRRGAATTP